MPQLPASFVQQLAALLWCGRRNASHTQTDPKTSLKPTGEQAKTILEYRSDESTDDADQSTGSPDESDSDTSVPEGPAQMPLDFRPPPGLCASPGLGFPLKHREKANHFAHGTGKDQNSELLTRCLREIVASSEHPSPSGLEKFSPNDLEPTLTTYPNSGAVICRPSPVPRGNYGHGPQAPQSCQLANESVCSIVRRLAHIDAERIVVARKIEELGRKASDLLTQHFTAFGAVAHVFVSRKDDGHFGTAFIVMESSEVAVRVFQQGLVQIVSGVRIPLTGYDFEFRGEAPQCTQQNVQRSLDSAAKHAPGRFPYISEDNTLRSNLRKLEKIDAKCIITVRKIRKFGLGGARLLKAHFSQFGGVEDVLVSHSFDRRAKEHPLAKPTVRLSDFGFIVMERAEDAVAVLQHGLEQEVFGTTIRLSTFEHHGSQEMLSSEKRLEAS